MNAELRTAAEWFGPRVGVSRPAMRPDSEPVVRTRPDVVVLRTNPKDSSLRRLLTVLTERHRTLALVWDRSGDYDCPVKTDALELRLSRVPGRYHHVSTLLGLLRLQPWLLWQTLRARPRVVHAMDLDTGVTGLLAARLLRVPFVYQCLDPYAGALPVGWPAVIARLVNMVENAVISRADLFVITDRLRMTQHRGASPRHIIDLPNAPMERVRPGPWSDGELVVGYIGSLLPHRSLELLVDTVGALAEQGVRLVLGGFGPLEDDLRRRCAVHPNIAFLGWVDDDAIMSTMATFDVFVQIEDPEHPAYRWASPNKLFESMALGRPIVVAQGTLAAERVGQSGHGVTVPFADGSALRTVLLGFLDHPERLRRLGSSGHSSYLAHWAPDLVKAEVLGAYGTVLNRREPEAP